MKVLAVIAMMLMLVSLGFAQEPAESLTRTTATATAVSTTTSTLPQTPTEISIPKVSVGSKQVDMQLDVSLPSDTAFKSSGLKLYDPDVQLVNFFNQHKCIVFSRRTLRDDTVQTDIVRPGNFLKECSVDGKTIRVNSCGNPVWQVAVEVTEEQHFRSTLCGKATGRVEVPTVTVESTTECIQPSHPVYIQPPPTPCAPPPPPQPAYCPPPPPPRPVVYLQVDQWAAPPTSGVCAPGTITVMGQPAFLGGGFSYSEGTRIVVSNGSSSTSTGGTAYGGSAWQNQRQGQLQGQTSWNNNQNRLNGSVTGNFSNLNDNRSNAAANAAAQTNTGIAIDN